MASHFMPLFYAFSLLFLATSGRELRNDSTRDTVTAKTKQLSDASPSYFGKTNYNDEQGLVAIYSKYTLMLDFNTTGDPCLPTPLPWIKCNSDANPRVIALNLNNRKLSGEIPDFSSMDALQRIDLSENRFTGNIPSFLGSFPHLQDLNLSFNLFNGSVPNSIAINKKVKISKYASNISDEPSNFHSVSKQVVTLADAPAADAPSDGLMAGGPQSEAPSDGLTADGPQVDTSTAGPTAEEPTTPADVSVTPPAPSPADEDDDESPPSDVPAIVGGTTAGSFVVLSTIGGILYMLYGCWGGSSKKSGGCALCNCSFNIQKEDTVSKGDSNSHSNAQPGGSPAGIVSPIK